MTSDIDPLRARHLSLASGKVHTKAGENTVLVNEAESPLVWLARRKGSDGAMLIDSVQLQAGERLRADFTRAQLMPRTTSNWTAPVASAARSSGGGAAAMTDAMVAARQRVNHVS